MKAVCEHLHRLLIATIPVPLTSRADSCTCLFLHVIVCLSGSVTAVLALPGHARILCVVWVTLGRCLSVEII